MRWKQIEKEPKTFALIFETGDEIATVLKQFVDEGYRVNKAVRDMCVFARQNLANAAPDVMGWAFRTAL